MNTVFILVEPARAENIGAAARALKTMGFADLWLVASEPPGEQAYWVAHQSDEIVRQARLFPNLASALAEVDFSIASSARRRLQKDDYLSPEECASALRGKQRSTRRTALVFGRESSGLSGDELALCDAVTRVPLACEQPSLNLAQAVMLYAWELSRQPDATTAPQYDADTYATVAAQLDTVLTRLQVGADDNARLWAREALARCDDRDLGLLMMLLKRLG